MRRKTIFLQFSDIILQVQKHIFYCFDTIFVKVFSFDNIFEFIKFMVFRNSCSSAKSHKTRILEHLSTKSHCIGDGPGIISLHYFSNLPLTDRFLVQQIWDFLFFCHFLSKNPPKLPRFLSPELTVFRMLKIVNFKIHRLKSDSSSKNIDFFARFGVNIFYFLNQQTCPNIQGG